LQDLSKSKEWKQIQKSPSTFKFPNGESFLAAQRRVQRSLNSLSKKYPKSNILIVSHGDIIKMAVASTLNLELDKFQRIIVDPASITITVWQGKQKSLISLNSTPRKGLEKRKSKDLSSRRLLGGGSGE
jgi:probable phosphoglycerate mutase